MRDDHLSTAVGDKPAAAANPIPTPNEQALPLHLLLADPTLALAADVLDDMEKVKIANQNRLRALTRDVEDSDGEIRGFGLDLTHPDVARLAALVQMLETAEHQAVLNLQRSMRKHPLGPWVKAQRGIGEKQAARLLAVIGDPFVNGNTGQPRTVSQLWAFCGLHVIPTGQSAIDTQCTVAGGDSSPAGGDPSQSLRAAQDQPAGVAARRQKGQRANWSSTAKSRAYLIAESILKAGGPYREVYDQRREATRDRVHAAPCQVCAGKGKAAAGAVGEPWRLGHQHADALRIVSKRVLRDLWREARRLHLEAAAGLEGAVS